MRTQQLISVSEYLSTSYDPDCDYVDGVVEERNVGEEDHSYVQTELATYLNTRRREWGVRVYVEQRVQVSPTRFRVPDICVILGARRSTETIFTAPPFICVEVLSPEDRLTAMQRKLQDYLAMGVPNVWVIDPRVRKVWRCTVSGMLEVAELRTESPEIVVPLATLFDE